MYPFVRPPRHDFGRAGLGTVALALALAAGASTVRGAAPAAAAADAAPKVLRYAMRVAETGFDPAQITDLYSATLVANMFDALYEYEFLARPVRLRPNTAAALPEVSADFKTFTIRVKPGISFSDDPAFKGVSRGADGSRLRLLDQAPLRSALEKPGAYQSLNNHRFIGLDEVRQAALREKKPFDYDAAGRGPARARPLHDPDQAGRAEPALCR